MMPLLAWHVKMRRPLPFFLFSVVPAPACIVTHTHPINTPSVCVDYAVDLFVDFWYALTTPLICSLILFFLSVFPSVVVRSIHDREKYHRRGVSALEEDSWGGSDGGGGGGGGGREPRGRRSRVDPMEVHAKVVARASFRCGLRPMPQA